MKSQPKAAGNASELISERIAELGDWRGDTLARMRALIREADPDVMEEWKWMGTPVWSHDGGICTGESYKSIVKLTFYEIDANAFKALIRAAVALNTSGGKKSTKRK
jgi:hypothetical protein